MDRETIKALKSADVNKRKDAIKLLAKSLNPEAFPLLADVYRNDPDADVRELARKAGVYIKKNTAQDFMMNAEPEVDAVPLPSEIKVSATAAERAKTYLSQAFDVEVRGDLILGIKLLQKALKADPRLVYDVTARTLASSLTGLPEDEALRQLTHADVSSRRSGGGISLSQVKVFFMMLAGLGMLISFFLPYLSLSDGTQYSAMEIFQDKDGIASMLSMSPENFAVSLVTGVSPITYTLAGIAAIGALQLLIGIFLLMAEHVPSWYWLTSAGLAIFAIVPFFWLFDQKDNLAEFMEFVMTFGGGESIEGLDVLFAVKIVSGFWIGAVSAVLMILFALYGLLFAAE